MATVVLDQKGREIYRDGRQTSPPHTEKASVGMRGFGLFGLTGGGLLPLVGRTLAVLAFLALGAIAGLAGAVLVVTVGALLGARLVARTFMMVGKGRSKTSSRGQGQGEQAAQNDLFHGGISSFSFGIRGVSLNRDRSRNPVTFFYSGRIPPQESQK